MTDLDALHAAILRHPAEDAPRLAYADELDERGLPGDADRAALIRWQCGTGCMFVRDPDVSRWRPSDRRAARSAPPAVWQGLNSFLSEPLPRPFVARRGFVAEVSAPLAVLVGGECGRCRGTGIWSVMGPEHPGPINDRDVCPGSRGIRRVPGVLPALVRRHPLERATPTDLPPTGPIEHGPQIGCYFFPRRDVPPAVWDRLEADRKGPAAVFAGSAVAFAVYWTRDAATAAMSAALLAWAREEAARD